MVKLNLKKENERETSRRVMSLAKNIDCGMVQPPMDAQVALNELARHLLGSDYCIVNSVNAEQANTQIVYDIEMEYRRHK